MDDIKKFRQTLNTRGKFMMMEDTQKPKGFSWSALLVDFVEVALMTLALFAFFILGFCL